MPWFDLMSIDAIFIIIIGAAFGGLVNGLAGFGTGLFALGWWLQVLPPTSAVALVVILSFVSGVQGAFAVRQALNWPRLCRFLIPAIAGLPFGFAMLDDLDVGMLKLLVGSLLALFGGFFILRPRFARWQRDHKLADIAVGFIGGVLGALAGLSGALPTIWSALHNWHKGEQRAVLQPFNVLVLGIVMVVFGWRGLLHQDVWIAVAIALPSSIISARLGIGIFRRLTESQFRQILIWLILSSGIVLVGRELVALLAATG
jgi:uncharacterized membrane protein YfcA